MNIQRCLYRICWRNRLFLPLIFLCVLITMTITFTFHPNVMTSSNLSQEKKCIFHQKVTPLGQEHDLCKNKFESRNSSIKNGQREQIITKLLKDNRMTNFENIKLLGNEIENMKVYKKYKKETEDILNQNWDLSHEMSNRYSKPNPSQMNQSNSRKSKNNMKEIITQLKSKNEIQSKASHRPEPQKSDIVDMYIKSLPMNEDDLKSPLNMGKELTLLDLRKIYDNELQKQQLNNEQQYQNGTYIKHKSRFKAVSFTSFIKSVKGTEALPTYIVQYFLNHSEVIREEINPQHQKFKNITLPNLILTNSHDFKVKNKSNASSQFHEIKLTYNKNISTKHNFTHQDFREGNKSESLNSSDISSPTLVNISKTVMSAMFSRLTRNTGNSLEFGTPVYPVRQVSHKHLKGSTLAHYGRKNTTYHNLSIPPGLFEDWEEVQQCQCGGKFRGYNNEFAFLSQVVLDQNFCTGPKGGEDIQDVLNQAEEGEYYKYLLGFFQMSCDTRLEYYFNSEHHLSQWLYSINTRGYDKEIQVDQTRDQFTIAITRYEYANMYHTMTDLYNAFLMMEFFNKTQADTDILLVDGHPKGAFDSTWEVLFNAMTRMSSLPPRTRFSSLAWSMVGYESPMMDHGAPDIPLVDEFHDFFLKSYSINDSHILDCKRLNILFIWRRDYVAHPRNPSGLVSRKIDNEKEILESVRTTFPKFRVQGSQIDLYDMHDQLQMVSKTDILLGMHGAGLTHAMFLPGTAAVAEFIPIYWLSSNEHFEAIARWRGLHFDRWVNMDQANEVYDHVTYIPLSVVNRIVEHLWKKMCDSKYKGELAFLNDPQEV